MRGRVVVSLRNLETLNTANLGLVSELIRQCVLAPGECCARSLESDLPHDNDHTSCIECETRGEREIVEADVSSSREQQCYGEKRSSEG